MYKAITYLEKLCRRLVGAAKTHGREVADAVAQEYRGRFRGAYPDVLELHTIVAERLETLRREVVAAETSLMASLSADQRGRAMRNRFFTEGREQLLALRKVLDGMFGPGASDVVFMKLNSFVHVDPVPLHRQLVLVHDKLLDPDLPLPEPRFAVEVDLQGMAREMEPNIEGLGRKLDELALQGTQRSVATKEKALAETSRKAGRAARLLEALAEFAGLPGIAQRIRLSSHVSNADDGEAAAPADPAPADAGAAPTDEAPAGDGAAEGAASDAGSPEATDPAPADGPPAES